MRREICICAEIDACRRSITSRTRVVILMHQRERCRTTNTARLAQQVLAHCEIRVRGLRDAPLVTDGIVDPIRHTFFFYPSSQATELTPEFVAGLDKPVTLVVPDGTWGQAAKVAKRETSLHGLRHVKLAAVGSSQYELRRGSKENGLATFEAIARALGVLESTNIQSHMEALFQVMVHRTLRSRGLQPQG